MVLLDTPPESPLFISPMDEEHDFIDDATFIFSDLSEDESDEGENDITVQEEETEPSVDNAKNVFTKHTGPVFSCHVEPKKGQFVVTGGQDDNAFVWEVGSGNVVMECKGHKDSVICVKFSHDGSYVATGDMDGLIQVWKMSTKSLIWSSEDKLGELMWLKWHHMANVLFVGWDTGEVFVWKIPCGDCIVLPGHGCKTDCAALLPDGKRIAVGYENGAIKIFDIKASKVLHIINYETSHTFAVTCIHASHDNNLLISGDLNGRIVLSSSQSGKVLNVFDTKTMSQPAHEEVSEICCVEDVKFYNNPNFPFAISVNNDGFVCLWDISKQALRYSWNEKYGITTVVWRDDVPIAYLAGLDGVVLIYNAQNCQQIGQLRGHDQAIFDLCLSPDGRNLVSVSDDHEARIFEVQAL